MGPLRQTYSGTRFGAWYFLLQGIAVLVWWILLWMRPAMRSHFRPPGASELDLLAFALPDAALVVLGSLVAGALALSHSTLAVPLAWLVAGAVDYAALYCIAWAALRGGGWMGVVAMAPAALFSTIAALDGSPGLVPIFRRANPASSRRHIVATLAQIVLFWTFFLFLVPSWIAGVERELGIRMCGFSGRLAVGWVMLAAASILGLASGWTMSARGLGTPLPMDATNRLVTSGPYGYVRNPMVVAGLTQGLASSLLFGSPAVVVYVVTGGLIWQFLVRPAEERELGEKFGESFDEYRAAVRCWIPNSRPYRPRA